MTVNQPTIKTAKCCISYKMSCKGCLGFRLKISFVTAWGHKVIILMYVYNECIRKMLLFSDFNKLSKEQDINVPHRCPFNLDKRIGNHLIVLSFYVILHDYSSISYLLSCRST